MQWQEGGSWCRLVVGLDRWRPWGCDPIRDGNCTGAYVWTPPGMLAARAYMLQAGQRVAEYLGKQVRCVTPSASSHMHTDSLRDPSSPSKHGGTDIPVHTTRVCWELCASEAAEGPEVMSGHRGDPR